VPGGTAARRSVSQVPKATTLPWVVGHSWAMTGRSSPAAPVSTPLAALGRITSGPNSPRATSCEVAWWEWYQKLPTWVARNR
jgi:hypothetical protein